jgi:deoxyribonuclease-4
MPLALPRAAALGATAIQVFVQNQQQWHGRPIGVEETTAFRRGLDDSLVRDTLAHASYLANLASPDDVLFERSLTTLHEEMRRCEALQIGALVLHPGAHLGSGEAVGLRRITSGIRWLLSRPGVDHVAIWLESTAGQGSGLGHRFEHLAQLLADVGASGARLGVCLDTCHLLAAGYDFRSAAGFAAVFAEFESVVGLANLRGFHLNDSKTPLGSRVDRHAEIGAGYIGAAAFGRLVREDRFAGLPMVLETPGGEAGYRRGLQKLRRMLQRRT